MTNINIGINIRIVGEKIFCDKSIRCRLTPACADRLRFARRQRSLIGLVLLTMLALASVGSATSTFVPSKNVLEIDENANGVGGPIDSSLFMTGGAFNAGIVNWTHINLGQFSDVGSNDTAILFQVNTSDMTTTQKTTLANFVTGGGKLIIWDAGAGAQPGFPNNYDWLPTNLVFSTSVPGQLGASGGVLQITEENDLSSSNPASPKFINTNLILNSTDAIGDGNKVKTNGTDWCQDMFGQNVANPPQSGPAHMYSRPGGSANNGFIVYSALDWDSGSAGGAGGNELRKILQFELDVGNTSNLPCSVEVVSDLQQQNGSISGMKFNDLNDNGIHDSGESGIQNWQIKLTDQNGNAVTNLTDNNGNYKFIGLADGNYAVDEVLQSGWNQTFPATGNYAVEIINGLEVTGKDFGNFQSQESNITTDNISAENISCDTENHVKVNIKGKDNNVKVAVTGSDNHVKVNIKGTHNRINLSVTPCKNPVDPINSDPPDPHLGGAINSDHLVTDSTTISTIANNSSNSTNINNSSILSTGIAPYTILRQQRIAVSNGEYY